MKLTSWMFDYPKEESDMTSNNKKKIGILAFHGDVDEHMDATKSALVKLNLHADVCKVRTKEDLVDIAALIIPGGESTVISQHILKEDLLPTIQQINFIFGTCAGAILLAKKIHHKAQGQQSLGVMDISVDRNAYGRQTNSFEKKITTKIGSINAVFIRAPKISILSTKKVSVLGKNNGDIVACEQFVNGKYYLALSFHPELTTTLFHEYFLKKLSQR